MKNRRDENVIAFYTTKEVPYGCFSNFYRAPIDLDGRRWPTSEHYYQARKSDNFEDAEKIRHATTPKDAAFMGRRLASIHADWDSMKYNVMLVAVRAKFTQHKDLAEILLSTGDKEIVEWTEGTELADSVWGNAPDKDGKPGQNLLGKALMQIRAELVKQKDEQPNELDI